MTRIKGEFFYAQAAEIHVTATPPPHGPGSPGPTALAPFVKPWRSCADQLRLLEGRGLAVSDRSAAEDFLSHVNYYRLSGYCLAFEQARHLFAPGTTFEQIRAAYEFDRVLRDILTEALEIVEVDVRTAVAHHFGNRYGAFGHTIAANFFPAFRHQEWLDKLHTEAQRSNEQFVRHFRSTYQGFPNLPVWMATEVMSFGGLSIMFKGLLRQDQRVVAQRYGVQPRFLASWLHHLVYVRNVCAHHARVWDRIWAIKPDLPPLPVWNAPITPDNQRLLVTLLILRKLLARCAAISRFDAEWKSRVQAHLAHPPATRYPLERMGLSRNWAAHPVWV